MCGTVSHVIQLTFHFLNSFSIL